MEYKDSIENIAEIVIGGTPKTTVPEYWNGNIPWISIADFNNDNKFIYKTEKFITKLGLQKSSTKMLKKGDIIISARGTVGKIGILGKEMAFNQSCYGLRAKKNIVRSEYLYYALKNSMNYIKNNTHGSVFDTITKDTFKNIKIDIISLEEQDKIIEILGALDRKIELNIQINNNLFETSKQLYERWFINFEFPNKKGRPYKFSGEEMVDSELGKIPKGWKVGFINDGELTKIIKTGIEKFDGVKNYVATADVDGANINNYTNVIYDSRPSRANMQPIANSVWFAKMQDSTKNILVDSYMRDILQQYIFSTGFMGIECLNNSLYYIWNYINSKDFVTIKNNLSTGTLMAGVNNTTISGCKYLIPDQEILNMYNEKMKIINIQIYNNINENKTLKKLRDTLLPKLMNGEIDLDKVEI